MANYSPPLAVVFVWHPANANQVKPLVEYCQRLLSRDIRMPFARSMNLPVFLITANEKGKPAPINTSAKKTMVFVFASKDMVGDDEWFEYLTHLPQGSSICAVPVAVDSSVFTSLKGVFQTRNYIRAYDFGDNIEGRCFIAIAHEVYRWSLNESLEERKTGDETALKLFLSHCKDGETGLHLARSLKQFIDHSPMRNFFDATDTGIGYKFDEEIERQIKSSTLVAIHSDPYSSRYWCQREILCAKENKRPIIAVDTLENFEDRRFPFASNVPSVHIHVKGQPSDGDMLRILTSALLETVRFYYSKLVLEQFASAGLVDAGACILSRPPEVADIPMLLSRDGDVIYCRHKTVVYPDPPVYSEEHAFLGALGIQCMTPLTSNNRMLQGWRVGLSISEPSEEELLLLGQATTHLVTVSQEIARHLLARCSVLVYGGDLRRAGFTGFVLDEGLALQTRLSSLEIYLEDYLAWPLYLSNTQELSDWKAKYRSIARLIEVLPPQDVEGLIINKETFLPPTNAQNWYVWSRCLTTMRETLIERCDARVCAGGRHSGYKGLMPGVLEEILLAATTKKPLFLLGGFGGVTASVCKILRDERVPVELTLEWQLENNAGYGEMLRFAKGSVDYRQIVESLRSARLNNGLSEEENGKLFETPFVEEAVSLIIKGLSTLAAAT